MYVKFTPLSLSLYMYIVMMIVELFLLYLYPVFFLAAECKIVAQASSKLIQNGFFSPLQGGLV